jgi:RNA polymerase sigma factor (sigma-70 family)
MTVATSALVAASAQSRPTFAEVYERHADTVYRFCLSQLADPHAAEDAAADAFTIALAAYERVDPDEGVLYWLLAIARRVVSGHRRRGLTRQRLQARIRLAAPPDPDVGEVAATRDDLREVIAAISHLRSRDRLLVGLRLAAHLSHAEIAEVMGMSEASARVATHRAVGRLRTGLETLR